MKIDLVIAGVGGQGILSIAAILARAALNQGWRMKQSEIHGMAQRGGGVRSHLRLADHPISSDVIPYGQADMILSVEPMEALRYLPYLKADGWVVSNTDPVINITNYPDVPAILEAIRAVPNHFLLDAPALAREHGSARAMNVAMLGAAAPFLHIPDEAVEAAITAQFESKGGKIVDLNLAVFRAARAAAAGAREAVG